MSNPTEISISEEWQWDKIQERRGSDDPELLMILCQDQDELDGDAPGTNWKRICAELAQKARK